MTSHEQVITELLSKYRECSERLLTWAQDEATKVKEEKQALRNELDMAIHARATW